MLPSQQWRLFLLGFWAVIGFLIGGGLTWNIVGSTCSNGGTLRFSFWPDAICTKVVDTK